VVKNIIPKEAWMNKLLIKNEIRYLKKLSHSNIVRIFELYESKNNFYWINEVLFCKCHNYLNIFL
jgi:serine/threonine protein kinase